METMIKRIQEYERKLNAYNLALSTMSFDQSTIAPKKGADYRIEMMSILSGDQFDYMIHPDHVKMLEEASKMATAMAWATCGAFWPIDG